MWVSVRSNFKNQFKSSELKYKIYYLKINLKLVKYLIKFFNNYFKINIKLIKND